MYFYVFVSIPFISIYFYNCFHKITYSFVSLKYILYLTPASFNFHSTDSCRNKD
nr:MAG TPA: hypothetical protein [Caudoviricetes sp.]